MQRSTSPILEPHQSAHEYPTPTKAKIQGAIEFCDKMGIKYHTKDVFRVFGVSRPSGYRLLHQNNSNRRHHNNAHKEETRGREQIVTKDQIKEMEQVLEHEGLAGRALTWEQLGLEAGVEACGWTIQRTMGTLIYYKCVACQRVWVSKKLAERRQEYARIMLERYPEPHDWDHVRFSDEVHFGYGPQGKLMII